MESNCIIPIHEIVKIFELKPVKFIGIVPFFNFSIGLRMIYARFNMCDFIFFFSRKFSSLLSALPFLSRLLA